MISKPILEGKVINLRPIMKADAKAMFASLGDEESMRLTGTTQQFEFEQVEAFCAKLFEAEDRVDYAITVKNDPSYIGEVVLNNIDFEQRSANFRIALASTVYFGKGYGSEATKLILQHAFETLNLHRVELEVYDFNPRAQHVYEKLGFQREGLKRDVLLWEGNYQSAIIMSMLKDDYLRVSKTW